MIEVTRENITDKDYIEEKLMFCGKQGMDALLHYMDENGFYEAPCSGANHLAEPGGLAKHTRNVLRIAEGVRGLFFEPDDTRIVNLCELYLVCALHDLGKMGQFGKENYVENILKSGKRSDAKPYVTNPDLQYIPHECRSIAIASKFIDLTENEQSAILYHNGLYGDFRYCVNGKETPLYLILHFADMWASRIEEKEKKEEV